MSPLPGEFPGHIWAARAREDRYLLRGYIRLNGEKTNAKEFVQIEWLYKCYIQSNKEVSLWMCIAKRAMSALYKCALKEALCYKIGALKNCYFSNIHVYTFGMTHRNSILKYIFNSESILTLAWTIAWTIYKRCVQIWLRTLKACYWNKMNVYTMLFKHTKLH